ncbi:unnamed protein product, partial [Ixodes hexagonus]
LELSVETAVRAGYRHIDTAYSYRCEASVGAALHRLFASHVVRREELFITTKLPRIAHSRDRVWYSLQKSLEDLKLDYVDLYLIEFPVPGKPGFESRGSTVTVNERDTDPAVVDFIDLMETWSGMEDVYSGRLARAIGLSNFNCKQLKRIYDNSKIKPCNLQIECHLYLAQNKVVNFCKAHGVAVTAYAPLGRTKVNYSAKLRVNSIEYGDPRTADPLEDPAVMDLARCLQRTPAQVLLRYQVQRGLAVVARSENPEHIQGNLRARPFLFFVFDFQLTPTQMSMLQGLDQNLRYFKRDHHDEVVQHPEYPFRALF